MIVFSPLHPAKGVAQAVQEAVAVVAALTVDGAGRVLAQVGWLHGGRGVVARAAAADVVDGTGAHLLLAGALAIELIVKREGSLLGGQVNVAGAATAAAELGGGLGQAVLEEGGRTRGGARVGGLGGLEGVAGAATAGVDVVAGGWVRFGDGV